MQAHLRRARAGNYGGTDFFRRNRAAALTAAEACKWVAPMFALVFKIVRALLCATALALIGAGTHAIARMDAGASETEVDVGALERAKPAPVIAARAGSTCPLALAVAQTNAPRVWAPAGASFMRFAASSARVVAATAILREADRQSWPSRRVDGVRLLI